jgi:hypothetical protein
VRQIMTARLTLGRRRRSLRGHAEQATNRILILLIDTTLHIPATTGKN